MEKSSFFSVDTKNDVKNWILEDLGARVSCDLERYLELPSMVGLSKYNTFRGLNERIWKKIHNLKHNFLKLVKRSSLNQLFRPYQHIQ